MEKIYGIKPIYRMPNPSGGLGSAMYPPEALDQARAVHEKRQAAKKVRGSRLGTATRERRKQARKESSEASATETVFSADMAGRIDHLSKDFKLLHSNIYLFMDNVARGLKKTQEHVSEEINSMRNSLIEYEKKGLLHENIVNAALLNYGQKLNKLTEEVQVVGRLLLETRATIKTDDSTEGAPG
jgi:hypothetical protein